MADNFYRWFSQQNLTRFGRARKARTERRRLGLLARHAAPPGAMLEIGPGHGSFAAAAIAAGWGYRALEASPALAEALRARGIDVVDAWVPPIAAADASCDPLMAIAISSADLVPPIAAADASCDVVYADQVLECVR